MMMLLFPLVVVTFIIAATTNAQEEDVTVIGLGYMGSAVARCLAATYTVHGWNRGESKRNALRDVVNIYDTPEEAIEASVLTLVLIDDWKGAKELLLEHKARFERNNRTAVVFSTYAPTDIHELAIQIGSNLVGGAIVGVPQTICTPQSLILTTASIPTLDPIGRTVAVAGDVGLAALANLALVLTITFGLAGHELAHLMIAQYGAPPDFVETYSQLASQVGVAYTGMLLPAVSHAMTSSNFADMYVPTVVFAKVLKMMTEFLDTLAIADDTFLHSYLRSLEKVRNPMHGPAAWTLEARLQPVEEEL